MGEDHDLHVEPHRRQAELRLIGVDHHGGFASAKPYGVQTEVGHFHRAIVYIRSGAETPIRPSAFAIVVRAAFDRMILACVKGWSSVTTRQFL